MRFSNDIFVYGAGGAKRDIFVYGAGGAGREFANAFEHSITWQVRGFIDDTKQQGEIINGIPVLGGRGYLLFEKCAVAMCIVENPQVKRELIREIKIHCPDVSFPVILNEESSISRHIEWGEGCIVSLPYNFISVNLQVGDFVWINVANIIGHDVRIGEYSTLYSGINVGGHVRIGSECVIGSGAIIKPGVVIGDRVIVGAGAVVVKDVDAGAVVMGNPAREKGEPHG
ncbi:MAG: NeuD/PglB/VioB family sugar acetyltransferase [Candidatus Omnitrophica bacterium]|jgi:sugar O-acyltransferase (sialic acid O-acetyltransferase NeuD family)|nr:NeuD/PglB/VioB family sugar acetyltransferase [Candidatus Omnitrophota bacterium]